MLASPSQWRSARRAVARGLALFALSAASLAVAKPVYGPVRPPNAAPDDLTRAVAERIRIESDEADGSHAEAQPVDPEAVGVLDRVGSTLTGLLGSKERWSFALHPVIDTPDGTTPGIRALPAASGPKIVVDARILPVLGSEAALAYALAHDIGHLQGSHVHVRLTERMGVLGGVPGLQGWVDGTIRFSDAENALIAETFGLGVQPTPFSPEHEAEAMAAALMLGADAGYSPMEAVPVLDRLATRPGVSHGHLHPDSPERRAAVENWMEKARKRYERNRQPGAVRARASIWGDPGLADGG